MGWFSIIVLIVVCFAIRFFISKARAESKKQRSPITHSDPDIIPISANVSIDYEDSAGATSQRQITVSSSDGSRYLYAFCLLKKQPRTFRIDRIKSCVDTDTGEVVRDIPVYFKNKYNDHLH